MISRMFAPKSALAILLVTLMVLMPLTGCSEDQIIAGIKTAADVATQAGNILTPVNPQTGAVLAAVAKGLNDLDAAYVAYDKASSADKPGAIGVITALVGTLQSQLATILADVRVKNPALVTTITVAVAVANSAILVLANKVASNSSPAVTHAALLSTGMALPTVPNAKTSKDLAKAWNSTVGKDFQVKAH